MKVHLVALSFIMLAEFYLSSPSQLTPPVTGNQQKTVRLFMCGDVMTGRGIDQALPHPVQPVLYESWVNNARVYLNLAEQKNGNIPVPLKWDYIWGDAPEIWNKILPGLKIINLETSITTHQDPWPGKGINYRMHPKNTEVLNAAGIDYCSLANNHVMDWGKEGLLETLEALATAGIHFSGAGINRQQAAEPSVFNMPGGRVLIFSYAAQNSGVPTTWKAEANKPGVNLLGELNNSELLKIKQRIEEVKLENDIVVFSVHWGANWGYTIPEKHRRFSHMLLNQAGVDIIFGHSSHHPLGLEVYNKKLIIYGAGDFINDYEGISGHEDYRGELVLMYFPELIYETGELKSLKMVPMEIRNFKLHRATVKDARWLQQRLDRESEKFGAGIRLEADNSLQLEW